MLVTSHRMLITRLLFAVLYLFSSSRHRKMLSQRLRYRLLYTHTTRTHLRRHLHTQVHAHSLLAHNNNTRAFRLRHQMEFHNRGEEDMDVIWINDQGGEELVNNPCLLCTSVSHLSSVLPSTPRFPRFIVCGNNRFIACCSHIFLFPPGCVLFVPTRFIRIRCRWRKQALCCPW